MIANATSRGVLRNEPGRLVQILIADAQASSGEAIALFLNRQTGLHVIGRARGVREMLDLLENGDPIDLVLFDPDLAQGAGLGLIRTLLLRYPCLRVLIFTQGCPSTMVREWLGSGAHGCISRHEGLGALLRAIYAVHEGQVWAPRRLLSEALEEARKWAPYSPSELMSLTKREREICRYVAAGESNRRIAVLLGISESTVKSHLNHVFRKLRVVRRAELLIRLTRAQVTP